MGCGNTNGMESVPRVQFHVPQEVQGLGRRPQTARRQQEQHRVGWMAQKQIPRVLV